MRIFVGLLAGPLHARYAENEARKVNVNFAPENTNYQSWVNVNTEIETEVDIDINSPDCSDTESGSEEDKEEPTEVTHWFDKLKDFLDGWSDCNECVDLREYIRDLIRGDKVVDSLQY